MIIVDTNVVSEFMKDEPDPAVAAWAQGYGPMELGICVVTVEEVERGLALLPAGRRRRALEARWAELMVAFREVIAVYDLAAAEATARVLVEARSAGAPMGLADAQIAGICLSGGWPLATRNVRDFDGVSGLEVVDPFG